MAGGMELDPTDRRILKFLQQDASQSLDAISAAVNLSRNACWRRIKQMEETGVIQRKVALLDADKLGLGLSVFIQIRAGKHSTQWLGALKSALTLMPEITGAYRMTGDLDYLLHARVGSVAEYDDLYQRLVEKVDLADVSASFVMEELKATTALPV